MKQGIPQLQGKNGCAACQVGCRWTNLMCANTRNHQEQSAAPLPSQSRCTLQHH
jgi:hypothetical protein